jgi:hypothetical protein
MRNPAFEREVHELARKHGIPPVRIRLGEDVIFERRMTVALFVVGMAMAAVFRYLIFGCS